jgi:flagellar FliL protein
VTQRNQRGAASKALIVSFSLVLLLLLSAVGGAAWAVAKGKIDLESIFKEPEPPPVEMLKQPLFQDLDKFVVSLADQHTQHYMMLELSLVSHDPRLPDQAEAMKSVIRNALLKYFSTLTRADVRDELQDMETLQVALKDILASAAEAYGQPLAVEQVLLTNVVIQ